jgi:hypothetical protein
MTEKQYAKAIPDEKLRTAISGFLMRRGWEIAMRDIRKAQNTELRHGGDNSKA